MKPRYHITPNIKLSNKSMVQIKDAIDKLFPTDILDTLDRTRPYNGQPWTTEGIRGKQEVSGLTMRDIRDCFIRGCYDSAPTKAEDYPRDIDDLPWDDMDIIAVCQNMMCWIERYMGIYPNISKNSVKEAQQILNDYTIEIDGQDL